MNPKTDYYKCCKCGASASSSVKLHRFPNPGTSKILKATAWATYCWPDEDWSSLESLTALYKKHKLLCGKHFDDGCYTGDSRTHLTNHAIPGTKEYRNKLLDSLRSKISVSSIRQQMAVRWGCWIVSAGKFNSDFVNAINSYPENMAVRWGIVSAGKISSDFVNAINSYPENEQVVAAVAARDRGRAEEFAKLHNISNVFGSYQALAQSKGIIDVAYIGALNSEHYALSKLFLENGKHVLCEKPLCLNSKQAQALVAIAKKKRVFLMEAIWSRFSPAYISLKKEIESEKLGEVKLVEVNLGAPIVTVDRLSKKSLGGGAILDLGVYVIQFAQFIFKDEPTKVIATGALNEEGVDIVETIILEYSGGRRAVLNLDATMKLWNKATVTGTGGRATLEEPFHFPNSLTHADGTVENFTLHTSKIPYNFENSAGLVYESLDVARCIQEGLLESPHVSHGDSLIIAKIQDTVRKQLGVHFDVDDQEFS